MPYAMTSDQLDIVLRNDLGSFVVRVFQTLSPGETYLHNWHIDAVVHCLTRTHQKQVRRLIINQPPRSLKSICTSVAYVAWCLGRDPSLSFICVSYSNELAAAFQRQFRSVVTSAWYRRLFPQFRLIKETENECVTSLGGGRLAVSVGGTITGRGAEVIIIDDPLKADAAASEAEREALHEWFTSTLLSRLNDKMTGTIIVVAQRLHEDDLPGRLLRQGGWERLGLPAIALEDDTVAIGPDAFYHRRKGEALHPGREPIEVLNALQATMGPRKFSAQYLQRPIPLEGNLIPRDGIQEYDTAPEGYKVQSWDIASTTSERSDYSVCTTWVVIGRHYYLIDVWRGRLEFPRLRRKLIELSQLYEPDSLLIERSGPGLHMIQELKADPQPGVPEPIGILPEGDKLVRMEAQASRFDAGQVHLPKNTPWLGEFLHELLAFPRSRYDDQIDSVSQFLSWVERRNYLGSLAGQFAGPIVIHG